MSEQVASYRRILKSSSIIGGPSVVNILIGLVRTKVIAMLLVLIGPLVSFLLGHWYVSRLPTVASSHIALQEMTLQWQTLLRLGVPFMGAGLVGALVQLWIRVEVVNTLGAESLGHFQAASTISMQYIGFVLGAMGADYFQRLTSVISDRKAATQLVNEQTEIALLLSAPIFIAMIGLVPWIIHLLYSAAFMPSVEILRWQILGDVFKVLSWPLSFVILATGAGKSFFWSESLVLLLMGSVVALYSANVGLKITGIAFLLCYVVYLPVVYFLAKQRIDFKWTGLVTKLFASVFGACIFVAVLCTQFWWGSIVSIVLALGFIFYAFVRLSHLSNLTGRLGQLGVLAQKIF